MSAFVVFGGSNGIGASVVSFLLDKGERVISVSRTPISRDQPYFPNDCSDRFLEINLDLSDGTNVEKLREEFGDGLSGAVFTPGSGRPVKGSFSDRFNEAVRLNLTPNLNAWDSSVEALERAGGSAVFLSSIAASEFLATPVEYAMAKSAIGPMVGHLARMHPRVRVNSLVLGNIDTERSIWRKRGLEEPIELQAFLEENVPSARLANPNEVAKAIWFLLSDESSFVTGGQLRVDGGQTRSFGG